MTRAVTDDACSSDPDNLTGMTERHIIEYKARTSYPFCLPEETIVKVYNRSTGQEQQLKRIKKEYSSQGWVVQEDLYDAEDLFIGSKKIRYNKFGKVIYEEDMTGAIIERVYDENNNMIEELNPLGLRKLLTYDFCNRLITIQEGDLVKHFRYNLKNERIEETDYSGNVTHYFFDELGRDIGKELPSFFSEEGLTTLKTTIEYDLLDNPTLEKDSLGNITKTLFTIHKKPYLIQHPDGTVEKFIYDLDGVLTESVDKYGNTTKIISDYQGRPVSIEVLSPSGDSLKKTTRQYNAFHLISETDALGCVTHHEYDDAGRLIKKRRGTSLEEYVYDSLSRPWKTINWTSDQDAIVTFKQFDHKDRIVEQRIESLSGLVQDQVIYEYNAMDQITKETHFQAVTQFIYNLHGDLIETINPLGVSIKLEYDYHVIDAKGEKGMRITSIDPKGVLLIIDKNALGEEKRGEKKNSLGETLELWDVLFNARGEKSKRIDVAYHMGKQLRHVITSWKWDCYGRLESLTEGYSSPDEKKTSIIYNSFGQRASIIKPSGIQNFFSYDTLGRQSRWYS